MNFKNFAFAFFIAISLLFINSFNSKAIDIVDIPEDVQPVYDIALSYNIGSSYFGYYGAMGYQSYKRLTVYSFSSNTVVLYPHTNGTYKALCFDNGDIVSPSGHTFTIVTYQVNGNYRIEDNTSSFNQSSGTENYQFGNIPVFDSETSARAFLESGNKNGALYFPNNVVIDDLSFSNNANLESPIMEWDKGYLTFSNALDDVYVIVYGRWYSPDDIELTKKSGFADLGYSGLDWTYNAHSVVKSSLTSWISSSDSVQSSSRLYIPLLDSAITNFNTLLSTYPVDTRNFYGGFSENGKSLVGRDNYLTKIKQSLAFPGGYNQPEFFARYFYFNDDGSVSFSDWGHLIATSDNTTYTVDQIIEDTDKRFYNNYSIGTDVISTIDSIINGTIDSLNDSMISPTINWGNSSSITGNELNTGTDYTTDFKPSLKTFYELKGMFGVFPYFVQEVFTWLPSWIIGLICISITMMVALGIYHAIRG